MTLTRYLLRRTVSALLLVWLAASGAFVLTRIAPGDYASGQGLDLSPAGRDALRRELGLDRSIASQYVEWLSRAASLDFGTSFLYRRPVGELLSERAANTAVLACAALALATLAGVPLGVYTGSQSGARGARIVRALSLLLISIPPLVASLGLLVIAARTGWLPVGGMSSPSAAGAPWVARLLDLLRHLAIPAAALALPLGATLERLQSQAIGEALAEPFVRASLARGASQARAIWRHAWPASLGSLLGLYGVMIGTLFSGSFIVEVVASWPGLGRLMFDALRARDLYLVAGGAAAGAALLAAGTLAADVVRAAADPRARLGDSA